MSVSMTAAERGRSNRRRGHDAERAVARWLRTVGFPGAERSVKTGWTTPGYTSADVGDITGCGPLVISVKDCAQEQTASWMAELAAMVTAANVDLGVLVVRRRGHADPGRWWCWMTISDLSGLIGGSAFGPDLVRMELGDVVAHLALAGYGTPPDEEAAGA